MCVLFHTGGVVAARTELCIGSGGGLQTTWGSQCRGQTGQVRRVLLQADSRRSPSSLGQVFATSPPWCRRADDGSQDEARWTTSEDEMWGWRQGCSSCQVYAGRVQITLAAEVFTRTKLGGARTLLNYLVEISTKLGGPHSTP